MDGVRKSYQYEGERIWDSFRDEFNIDLSDFSSEEELREFLDKKLNEGKTRNLGTAGRSEVVKAALDEWRKIVPPIEEAEEVEEIEKVKVARVEKREAVEAVPTVKIPEEKAEPSSEVSNRIQEISDRIALFVGYVGVKVRDFSRKIADRIKSLLGR